MSEIKVIQLPVGPMENFSYLVSGKENEAVVIDPGWEPDKILNEAKKHNWIIKAVLLTHTHYDHARETTSIVKATNCPVYVYINDTKDISNTENIINTKDNQTFEVAGIKFKSLHLPGHTSDSQCFLAGNNLFSGDVLFVGNCGRDDLPESNPEDMAKSLAKLAKLPLETIVYPGHNYGPTSTSTIEHELKTNPYIKR